MKPLSICLILSLPGDDYNGSSIVHSVEIPAESTRECFTVDIINDDVNEPQQSFQLTAEIEGSTAPQATTTVTINDDDGRIGICMLRAKCRFGQPKDCPTKSSDLSFAQSISGLAMYWFLCGACMLAD